MSSKLPTLLFVPGSWLSTDIYRGTAAQLPEYRSVVIDQPTNKMHPASVDMHEDIEHTRIAIENELQSGNDVVTIAHSAGGLIGCLGAHGLSKAHRLTTGHSTGVVGYIGVASLLPHPGKTVTDMNAEFWVAKQNALAAELGPPIRTFDQVAAAYKFNEVCTMRSGTFCSKELS
ncbi:alpha/beta-Hydrolase [Penicillium sp. IBT 16267x]|nr:alpha/beta-Hydrolase [Penicillium sp. IBT 16267x]